MNIRYLLTKAPAILICWCLFYCAGCQKPVIHDTDLLTDDDDLSLAKDTLFAQVYTVYEQPLASNGFNTASLGRLTDPNFGVCVPGVYGQCRLASNNITFGTNPVLDSAYITFAFVGLYGKFDQPVNLTVFELNQSLIDSVTYYSNQSFGVSLPAIGGLNNYVARLTDSVIVLGQVQPPHLRIPLTQAFGNKILLADPANLADNTAFLNLFKGFYVTTTSNTGGNGLLYVSLNSVLSKISLYYHNDSNDSLSLDIPMTGVKVNHFDNNYTGSPVATSISNPAPNGEEKMYIQGGIGVKGKILLPTLDSLPKNISVNKAELVLTQSVADTAYIAPLLLDLFRIDDAGTAQLLEDDGQAHFGGTRVQENVNGSLVNRYRFNIKHYFQRLLQGTYANNGLYLQVLAPTTNAERVVIGNTSTNGNYKVTLAVTYTKL